MYVAVSALLKAFFSTINRNRVQTPVRTPRMRGTVAMNRTSSFTTAFAIAVIVNYPIAFTTADDACGAADDDDGAGCLTPGKKKALSRYRHIALGDAGNASQSGRYGSFGKGARQTEILNGLSYDDARFGDRTHDSDLAPTKEGAKEISCGCICRQSVVAM